MKSFLLVVALTGSLSVGSPDEGVLARLYRAITYPVRFIRTRIKDYLYKQNYDSYNRFLNRMIYQASAYHSVVAEYVKRIQNFFDTMPREASAQVQFDRPAQHTGYTIVPNETEHGRGAAVETSPCNHIGSSRL